MRMGACWEKRIQKGETLHILSREGLGFGEADKGFSINVFTTFVEIKY